MSDLAFSLPIRSRTTVLWLRVVKVRCLPSVSFSDSSSSSEEGNSSDSEVYPTGAPDFLRCVFPWICGEERDGRGLGLERLASEECAGTCGMGLGERPSEGEGDPARLRRA